MKWLNFITYSMDMNLSKCWEIVEDTEAWSVTVHGGHKESDTTKLLNNNIKVLVHWSLIPHHQ